jgi:hypothetical protein
MTYVTVNVDVDVDLSDLDTEDLLAELERRNKAPESAVDVSLAQIFDAFYLGNESRGTQMTKRYLQQVTGRVLPN